MLKFIIFSDLSLELALDFLCCLVVPMCDLQDLIFLLLQIVTAILELLKLNLLALNSLTDESFLFVEVPGCLLEIVDERLLEGQVH